MESPYNGNPTENVQYNGNAMRGNSICLLSIKKTGMELVGFLFMALFWVAWVNSPRCLDMGLN
jgi:hypothetical protein